jgi:hypothetical protein
MNLSPNLGFAAAALLIAGAGGTALAHPHAEGESAGKKLERIVVIHEGKAGEHHAGAGERIRGLAIHGKDGLINCNGGEKLVDDVAEEGGKTTKVILCSKGPATAADAERLEQALARISETEHLTDEQRARIETALRSAIDRARSAR